MTFKDIILEQGEFYAEVTPKDTIFLHHTAGSHRPDWVVSGAWENDKNKAGQKLPVATAFVIGGISTTDGNADWDGVIVRAFDEKYWAHHLGTSLPNNKQLNMKSVAIEICNYGYVIKGKDGQFYNYVNKPVPASMVIELDQPFRGYKFYHKYTDKQIEALGQLIKFLAEKFNINLKKGLAEVISSASAFELNIAAQRGAPGVWSHSNVLQGKFDLYPDPRIISLLKSL